MVFLSCWRVAALMSKPPTSSGQWSTVCSISSSRRLAHRLSSPPCWANMSRCWRPMVLPSPHRSIWCSPPGPSLKVRSKQGAKCQCRCASMRKAKFFGWSSRLWLSTLNTARSKAFCTSRSSRVSMRVARSSVV